MGKISVLIINGPNLNMLGSRSADIYGDMTLDEVNRKIADYAIKKDINVSFVQSNSEGELISQIQQAIDLFDGLIINAGAYSHTSIAIRDAISDVTIPVLEVHISNIFNRETFRHHSYLSPVCVGSITGFGYLSYLLALEYFALSA
jgi:3-dehydroquinate dehydratase-2